MKTIHVMLVDDHNLVRAGIRSLLSTLPGIEIVEETDSGRDALQLIEIHQPDIVLMDIALPDMNGLEVTARVKKSYPNVKVIFLSMYANEEYVLQALQVGGSGYLLKDASLAELQIAVRAVADGEAYLSPSISKHVIDGYVQRVRSETDNEKVETHAIKNLTARQREILQLIAEGQTTKEIAQKLDLSAKTVDAHRAQLMKELDIHDIAGLVRYAIRVGLVSSD